ncbi:hypothetical protein GCM10028819_18640 [Spirosoma humi]
MNKLLGNLSFAQCSVLSLVLFILLSGCSKPEQVDSPAPIPAQYELKAMRYFFNQGDKVDTTTLQLKALSVQNPGSVIATQQVEEGFGELMKTSWFTIDPTSQVPNEIDLSTFAVGVPEHWYGSGLFDRSVETYSITPFQQQKPYGFGTKGLLTVKIPPNSRIDISRQVTVYQLTCSFEGLVENITTGQQHSFKGKWKGVLQYANPSTTLKESVL